MQNNNNGLTIITSAILVAAFFMPWLQFIVSVSGWDIVFGVVSGEIGFASRYALIAIPVAGALILYSAALNNGNYPVSKGLLFRIPLLTLILVFIVLISKSPRGIKDADFLELSKVLGIGFWITLIGSIVLFFGDSKPTVNEAPAEREPNTNATDPQRKSE